MSDFKSKLPDLKEVAEITGKLFKDIKTSVSEIVSSYKQKHAEPAEAETTTEQKKPTKAEASVEIEVEIKKEEEDKK